MCSQKVTKLISVEFLTFGDLTELEGRLVQQAVKVRDNAQAPYSHFKVGAALVSEDEKIFYGCNVERADYSGITHAEQSAIDSMVANGYQEISMIVLAAAPKDVVFDITTGAAQIPEDFTVRSMVPPCGACLQKIWENCYGNFDVQILSVMPDGGIFRTTIGDIFPISFEL